MSTKPDPQLRPGDQVILPTGRPAVVRSVDTRRGEALVEALPWAAAFRVEHLRRSASCELLVLSRGAPGEEPKP